MTVAKEFDDMTRNGIDITTKNPISLVLEFKQKCQYPAKPSIEIAMVNKTINNISNFLFFAFDGCSSPIKSSNCPSKDNRSLIF